MHAISYIACTTTHCISNNGSNSYNVTDTTCANWNSHGGAICCTYHSTADICAIATTNCSSDDATSNQSPHSCADKYADAIAHR
jgi:hypothetical protein